MFLKSIAGVKLGLTPGLPPQIRVGRARAKFLPPRKIKLLSPVILNSIQDIERAQSSSSHSLNRVSLAMAST
jgi:hypothetical protein